MHLRAMLLVHWGSLVLSQTVLYMEPPNCTYSYTLAKDEVIYLDSSYPSNTENQDGDCSVHIENLNRSKHLNYYFELGPNITDCSAELIFIDRVEHDESSVLPHYTCNNLHPYKLAHADNWTGDVLVSRKYVTMRKDFFFRIRVVQVDKWGDHEDNGLGFYVDRGVTDPSVPIVLYIILGLDFLLPTIIFIVNEFSGRISDDGSGREAHHRQKNAAVGTERQAAFGKPRNSGPPDNDDIEGLFPFYKQSSDLTISSTQLKKRTHKTLPKGSKSSTNHSVSMTTASRGTSQDCDNKSDCDKRVNFADEQTSNGPSPRTGSRDKGNQRLRFSE